ncbi:hypothetical protein HUJ04_008174 [Dendroctonus ponderosae]|nr:hypothetical protein HUJ04_008174 [Dendroctonus ponderosae]
MRKGHKILNVKPLKLDYLDHIMRIKHRYGLLELRLQRNIYGRRAPGRRKIYLLQNLQKWFSMSTRGLCGTAASQVELARLVTNIPKG